MHTRFEKNILIAGIGNRLRGDDGFGPQVIDLLRTKSLPESVVLRDFGIAGITIASDLSEYDVAIFLDASRVGVPGELSKSQLLVEEGIDDINELSQASLHEVGLEGLLKFSRTIGTLPEKVILIGCVPKALKPSLSLSPEVAEAAQSAVDMVLDIIGGYCENMGVVK